jgi:hypothetical protein
MGMALMALSFFIERKMKDEKSGSNSLVNQPLLISCSNRLLFVLFRIDLEFLSSQTYIRPKKCNVPWPVANSVANAATKPSMAKRPFQSSA